MKSGRKKKSKALVQRNTVNPGHPGGWTPSFTITKVFRFQSNAAGPTTLPLNAPTTAGILMALGVATSTTSISSIFSAAKLRKICIWGPPASTLVPETSSITWHASSGGFSNGSKTVSDTSIGSTFGSYVQSKPEKGTLAAMWLQPAGSSTNLVTLNFPVNSIVDVHLSLRNDMIFSGSAVQQPVTGPATVGEIYTLAIDNAGILIPVTSNTIS